VTTVIIATAILGSAFGQRAQVHEPPLPLADPVFLSQVAAVSKDFKYAAGFLVASQPSLKVAQAKVPKKVLDYTVVWLRKVMRSDVRREALQSPVDRLSQRPVPRRAARRRDDLRGRKADLVGRRRHRRGADRVRREGLAGR